MDVDGNGPAGPDPRKALAPLERALEAFHAGARGATLRVLMDDGPAQTLPASLFFRAEADLLPADRVALSLCRGRVLDVGAGAGALALPLQERGFEVTALELLPGLAALLSARGVRDVRIGDLRSFVPERPYDTVIALMNGTASAGTLGGLPALLAALGAPLGPEGALLLDSTDLTRGGADEREDGRYVGELQYQLEYEGQRGPPFPQLFVDEARLAEAAAVAGLRAETAWRGEDGEFLARLTRDPRAKERGGETEGPSAQVP